MYDNYVEMIGYQLERVHTSVLSWLVNSENPFVQTPDRNKIVTSLIGDDVDFDNLQKIVPIQEHSIGRRRRIDLLIQIEDEKENKQYVLIECKTDSPVWDEQLRLLKKDFQNFNPDSKLHCVLLVIGAGQTTLRQAKSSTEELGYRIIDLHSAISSFSDLALSGQSRIYDDWIAALRNEKSRRDEIEQNLQLADNPWDPMLKAKGYRLGFPIFYQAYDKIREELAALSLSNWSIYSGSNNPVMNWNDGWMPITEHSDGFSLFWEFNWDKLVLKAGTSDQSPGEWPEFRKKIIEICESSEFDGKRAAQRKGTYVSLYTWQFNICRMWLRTIAEQVAAILDYLPNEFKKIV